MSFIHLRVILIEPAFNPSSMERPENFIIIIII